MMRGFMRYCKASVRAHGADCRPCAKPLRSAGATALSGPSLWGAIRKEGAPALRPRQIAGGLVPPVAGLFAWSASAAALPIVLWLIALVPPLDVGSVRREMLSAAGGLPVLLWLLAAIGMLWADVSWSERVAGLSGFHKLLCIPLLLAQFRRSPQARWAIIGFL